jgi:hypothetical protein
MPSCIVFDFGPLTFGDGSGDKGIDMAHIPTHREAVVRAALALEDEPKVWSAYLSATDFS